MNKKKETKKKDTFTYLKRVKVLGIIGIIISIALIGYDIYEYKNWISILSLVIDGILLVFSIYFIIKSNKLKKNEIAVIEKNKKNNKTKK